jgi:uncharacterized MAPEG superfamily protein
MKTDLMYLTCVVAFTGLMWVPYILDRLMVRGLADAVGYPENPKSQSPWAQRLMKAHANAVENLVIFASLVLVAHVVTAGNRTIECACIVYFWARIVHAIAYTFAIPLVRTLAFAVGFLSQATIAWQLLVR